MSTGGRLSRGWGTWIVDMAAVLVFYWLSIGPAVVIANWVLYLDWAPKTQVAGVINTVYFPIRWVNTRFAVAEPAHDAYMRLFVPLIPNGPDGI
jgi:hypothetical protein